MVLLTEAITATTYAEVIFVCVQRDKRMKLITGTEQTQMKMSMQDSKGTNGGE